LPDDKPGPIPTVIAAAPQSNAQKFVGWPAKKPFMVIIDKEGKVKYAGTTADFVPALILTELTGVEVDLAKQAQTTDTGLMPTPGMSVTPETPVTPEIMDPMMMEMMMSGMMPPTPAPRQVPEPNKPAADPNTPADPNAPAKVEQHAQPRPPMQSSGPLTLSLEDQVRAQHLLELAQMKIGESLRLRSNPKQGVEACREILAQFPNTQYAQQARELLRQVPERYKKMNNITDEELGY
jgi:hypothetical protein